MDTVVLTSLYHYEFLVTYKFELFTFFAKCWASLIFLRPTWPETEEQQKELLSKFYSILKWLTHIVIGTNIYLCANFQGHSVTNSLSN